MKIGTIGKAVAVATALTATGYLAKNNVTDFNKAQRQIDTIAITNKQAAIDLDLYSSQKSTSMAELKDSVAKVLKREKLKY